VSSVNTRHCSLGPHLRKAKISLTVLNKTPRDCTDSRIHAGGGDVQSMCGISCIQYKMPNKRRTRVKVSRKAKAGGTKSNTAPKAVEKERSFLQKMGALALRGAGAGLGYAAGNPTAGYSAGANISKFLGFGDYKVTQNSLVSKASSGIPVMHSSNMSTMIRHREYIGDVTSSSTPGAFNIASYPINPGLSQSFPWLSTVAQQYQEYTFKGLVYEFVSTSGESVASTNPGLGSVILATQYRSTALPFTSKIGMLNEYYATDGKPSACIPHAIECDPKENPFQIQYIRNVALITGEDEKMYDLGTFNIATSGLLGASVVCGELWCSYEVELKKPQLSVNSGIASAHYQLLGTFSTTQPLGSLPASSAFDNIGITFNVTAKSIIFPPGMSGNFSISIIYGSAVTAFNGGGAPTVTSGMVPLNIYRTVNAFNSNYTVGTGTGIVTYYYTFAGSSAFQTMTLVNWASLTGATIGDLFISQLNTLIT